MGLVCVNMLDCPDSRNTNKQLEDVFLLCYLTLGSFPGAAKQDAGDQVEPASGTDYHPLKH